MEEQFKYNNFVLGFTTLNFFPQLVDSINIWRNKNLKNYSDQLYFAYSCATSFSLYTLFYYDFVTILVILLFY